MGAICQCEKKFIKRGPRERQGENCIGPQNTINSEWATRCFANYSTGESREEKRHLRCRGPRSWETGSNVTVGGRFHDWNLRLIKKKNIRF